MDLDWDQPQDDAELDGVDGEEETAKKLFGERMINEVRSELTAFRNERVADRKTTRLNKWWKECFRGYPRLSRAARVTQAILAAQVENEKVFSAANLVIGHLRTIMSLERLGHVVFLMKNTNQEQIFREILKTMGDKAIADGDWTPTSDLLSDESILDMAYARLDEDDDADASYEDEAFTHIGNDMSSLVDDGSAEL
eukprot:jgi/Tetstr1/445474/TSEL_033253.t1